MDSQQFPKLSLCRFDSCLLYLIERTIVFEFMLGMYVGVGMIIFLLHMFFTVLADGDLLQPFITSIFWPIILPYKVLSLFMTDSSKS